MTSTLPSELQDVFERFVTTEYVTIDRRGQPIVWPVTPYYRAGEACIDVTTGLGYPKKARDAEANPNVALLFSDPTGSGLDEPPMVLVQGMAVVDADDLRANAERYRREIAVKLPHASEQMPPRPFDRFLTWYSTRLYIHVRPERVFVWPGSDLATEPQLFDTHLEEVRSGHNEEPEDGHADPAGGGTIWDDRMEQLGTLYRSAVLAIVGPDGFPMAVRVPVEVDNRARRIRFPQTPVGVPVEPGLACVVAHDHPPEFTWQRNFQVRGDLVEEDGGWCLVPHKLIGGFELPPGGVLTKLVANGSKVLRFRKIAKRELARRGG